MMLAMAALTIFMVVPALADQNCSTGNFVGTYTRASQLPDPYTGQPHNYVFQLTLHGDGTVTQYWTGLPDYQINQGTGSINIGAWKCRDNGNLLVTLISASYTPFAADASLLAVADDTLFTHSRTSAVFTITDNNTLTRLKAITRTYTPDQDPTDASGGTLGTLSTTQVVYKRLVASATDLN